MRLEDLRGRHDGGDVWVVGSDPTLSMLGPDFFEGRTVVGINRAAKLVPVTYTVTKADKERETGWLSALRKDRPGMVTVVSEYEQGRREHGKTDAPGAVVFKHHQNRSDEFDANRDIPTEPGWLLVSRSTSGSALHFAAHLGAANVFCVGIHGGVFGGEDHSAGYYKEAQGSKHQGTYSSGAKQVTPICRWLSQVYGSRFVTVLPGGNLRLGGVSFRSDYGSLN